MEPMKSESITYPAPSKALLHSAGNHAYILALINSFPCLRGKLQQLGWTKFDVERWLEFAQPWSSGERKAALFIACVWDPSYASKPETTFNVIGACGTWGDDNRAAFLAWVASPVWP
jgi:hypothetical protein